MRRFALLSAIVSLAGCNSILDIPERELLVEDDTGSLAIDSAIDSSIQLDTAVVDTGETTDASFEETAADTLGTDEVGDTATVDSATDTALPDSSAPDTAADTTVVDSGMVDSATPDTRDSATSDTSTPDTSMPTCGVTGKPCCGSPTAATCNTNSVCSAGSCIAAAGSCVRSTDCFGVCGGPTICAGSICFTCGAAAGTGALWATCTSASQCGTGLCDTIRSVCATACAPGITGDADCTALDPKAVCTAPNITVTIGSSSASGNPGFCARGCKKDSECTMTESCRIVSNNVMARLDLTCSPSPGGSTVDIGGACTSSNQCKRGACISSTCKQLCQADSDCSLMTPKCNGYSFTKPGGGTQIINACGT